MTKKKAISWSIFYTLIAAALFLSVIYGTSISKGYRTTEFALIAAIVISVIDLYWIRKAFKHIFN